MTKILVDGVEIDAPPDYTLLQACELAGACTDAGPPIAVLLFKVESRETVEAFARADPYVTGGLVTAWRVREWTTVAGRDALTKVG